MFTCFCDQTEESDHEAGRWWPDHVLLHCHMATVQQQVAGGAELNTRDPRGWTPLMLAALDGNLDLVRHFHMKGAELDICSGDGSSALTWACRGGKHTVSQYLVQAGADCSRAKEYLNNLLLWAGGHGDVMMAQRLVEAGASWCTASLTIAAQNGHLEYSKWMVEAGADTAKCLDPLLYCAAFHGDMDQCEDWLQRGADINNVNKDGNTPVNIAAKQGHHRLCALLMSHGADLNIPDSEDLAPLYYICRDGNADLAREFIQHGASVNSPGCIQVALETYNNDVAEILIALGCDINQVNIESD